MPGVYVTTSVQPGPAQSYEIDSSTYFVVGLTEWGDVAAPVLLNSMADYAAAFGSRVPYGTLFDDLTLFFANAGSGNTNKAYVQRVVGPSATTGMLMLKDMDATPANTLQVSAKSPGAWSSGVSVSVVAGAVTGQFRLNVYLNGSLVEVYDNLASPDAAVSATGVSQYIVLTNEGSETTAPANNPAVLAITPLSAGTDDLTDVTSTVYEDALALFDITLGSGAVAIPGQSLGVVGAALEAHCIANNRVCLGTGLYTDDRATVESYAVQFRTDSSTPGSEYMAVLYPWLGVADGAGGTRWVPPCGAAAGVRAAVYHNTGIWQPPAGGFGNLTGVTALADYVDQDDGDAMDQQNVSVIRKIGPNIAVYGWRSLSSDTVDWDSLRDRDMMNDLAAQAGYVLLPYVENVIDSKGQLYARVTNELTGLLAPYLNAGALWPLLSPTGQQIDPGYQVVCGPSNNPTQSLALNELFAQMAIRPAPFAAMINVALIKVALAYPMPS